LTTRWNVVKKVGCSIIGQTPELAPSDKRIYGVRDVTATVESVALITGSILSKKLAAGLDGLAMDVKVGNGAFMEKLTDARDLANSLATVATGAGLPTNALLTDMDQPLADTAGNALEMRYAIDYLTGARRQPRMHEIVVALGAEMLLLGKAVRSLAAGRKAMEAAIASGAAAEKFSKMVAAMGGPRDLVAKPEKHLVVADLQVPVYAAKPGAVTRIDTRAVGMAVVALGGGRTRPQDPIDHSVGLTELAALGDDVGADRPLAIVWARNATDADAASAAVRAAYRVGGRPAKPHPVIIERLAAS
jgi:thymidine phosphorylase